MLLALLGLAFGAGYYTRDRISRRRRERSERSRAWKNYTEPAWVQAANTNQPQPKPAHGDLGQMLGRWEHRARARRVGVAQIS